MSTSLFAQLSLTEATPYIQRFEMFNSIPPEYKFVWAKEVLPNGVPSIHMRYTKTGKEEMGGEHFSFIVSKKDMTLLGFTIMDKRFNEKFLPSKEVTAQIAQMFLTHVDEKLASSLKNLWIEQHEESINVNGEQVIVTGMKYKCYRESTNDYSWVIIGKQNTLLTFERDIKWDSEMQKRITEKYLHDEWLLNR